MYSDEGLGLSIRLPAGGIQTAPAPAPAPTWPAPTQPVTVAPAPAPAPEPWAPVPGVPIVCVDPRMSPPGCNDELIESIWPTEPDPDADNVLIHPVRPPQEIVEGADVAQAGPGKYGLLLALAIAGAFLMRGS